MRPKKIIAACLCLVGTAMHAQEAKLPFTEQDLVGEWDSGVCATYVRGPDSTETFIRRQYLFTAKQYNVRYSFFADRECNRATVTAHVSGRYTLGARVATAPAAREVDVFFDRVLMTVDSPEALPRMEKCGTRVCEVGVQQDVTENGCLNFKPKAACGVDYDIVSITGDLLHPGFRSANMCVKDGRPSRSQTTAGAKRRFRQMEAPPGSLISDDRRFEALPCHSDTSCSGRGHRNGNRICARFELKTIKRRIVSNVDRPV
jgi:Adenomatosis polyposis coli down-regulated 1